MGTFGKEAEDAFTNDNVEHVSFRGFRDGANKQESLRFHKFGEVQDEIFLVADMLDDFRAAN